MAVDILEFGCATAGVEYVLRPGGYAVIFNAVGEVAVVSTRLGLFLPGGGQDGSEAPEEAAIRETREECGLHILIRKRIGIADQLVFAADEKVYYRKRCAFFLAELSGETVASESDHQLIWLAPAEALLKLQPESQRWALAEALRLKNMQAGLQGGAHSGVVSDKN
jgi:8-oxo-dGTP diphosphatase